MIGILVLALHSEGFKTSTDLFFNSKYSLFLSDKFLIISLLNIAVLSIPIALLHEGLHGAGILIFGGIPRFGVNKIYFYTEEITGMRFSKIQYLIILLLPVSVISVICMFIPPSLRGMVFIINLIGSIGDFYMSFTISQLNEECEIIDKTYGFEIIKNERNMGV
jgi:hypothetical protein